jgi:hypothetical protein
MIGHTVEHMVGHTVEHMVGHTVEHSQSFLMSNHQFQERCEVLSGHRRQTLFNTINDARSFCTLVRFQHKLLQEASD